MRSKVTVVGAGNVGATTAQRIHQLGFADVVLVDVVEDLPQGKSLDMLQSGPVLGTDAGIVGSNGYEASAGSDVVVITAGIARKPGMSRDDLLLTNMKITAAVTEGSGQAFPRLHHYPRDKSPRRHGPERVSGQRLPSQPGIRNGRHSGHRPLPHLHRPAPGRVRGGRPGLRARRPRRRHGAPGPVYHRGRHSHNRVAWINRPSMD